ncbi:MAG: hypothetical protein IKJ07_10025 [Clostridia bacterium]|nr:hypothetical protein [Clostridia bacterium]
MKKDKKQIGFALLEILGEILITLVFFGIGALIINAFGVKLDSPNIDDDLIVLLGIVAFLLIFGAIYGIRIFVKWVKKTIKRNRD